MGDEFLWNEAKSESLTELHNGMLMLLAFEPNRSPKQVGTAFIVGGYGDHAVAISAAHNFHEGVLNVQQPKRRRHPSALPEFLSEISVDRQRLRAIYRVGEILYACVIGLAAWDKKSDLAVFTVGPQSAEDGKFFNFNFRLEQVEPEVGDQVGMLGYGNMETIENVHLGEFQKFSTSQRLVLRTGQITNVFPDGHSLCRTKCVETTIPVFDGMSGGPMFLMPEVGGDIVPFGLISSDPESNGSIQQKNDRSIPGASIAACLPISEINFDDDKRKVGFEFTFDGLVKSTGFDNNC